MYHSHPLRRFVDKYQDMLCIELDSESETHLFRHASEITRETKGGYLKGKIIVPKTTKPCYLRLSLVPAEPDIHSNEFHLHPNMLHINLRQNKKNRNLEMGELPHDVDWSFVFRIDPDGTVSRVSSTSHKRRFTQMQPIPDSMYSENLTNTLPKKEKGTSNQIYEPNITLGPLNVPEYSDLSLTRVTVIKEGRCLDLGTSGLMLNIITPLQKFSKGGTTITDVLQQRYLDLFHRPMTEALLKKIEETFTGKKDKVKLQRVRLVAEIIGCDPAMTFIKSTLSQIVMNSKSKECGPLRLHDVNPAASCHQSKTKIFILSFFKLVSEVKAAFILWDKDNDNSVNDPILEVLNQPEECTVFNQTVVVCMAPPQKWEVIQEIKRKNYELRICAYRPSDNRMSMNSFKFEYLPHVPSDVESRDFQGPSGFVCGSCHLQQFNLIKEELPLAKPGWQRRKHDEKKEIPDKLKFKNTTIGSNGYVISPLADVNHLINGDSSLESNGIMDLSTSTTNPATKRIHVNHELVLMTPPKKRRFAHLNNPHHHQICDSIAKSNPMIQKHITLPPR
jgi:hypothetical protein